MRLCGQCTTQPRALSARTYEWALLFGNAETETILKRALDRVEHSGHCHGAVVYCETCMRLTWIYESDKDSMSERLISHEKLYLLQSM